MNETLSARLGLGFKLDKKIKTKTLKIGLAVLIHDRPEYLQACLDSLFRTKLRHYQVTFLLIDDGSKDPRVAKIIATPRPAKYHIVRIRSSKSGKSWGAAFNQAMQKLLEIGDFDIIGSCDSDAIFHPDWLHRMLQICLWAKAHHHDHVLGPFSSFNSSDYLFHKVLGTYHSPYGDYVVKKRMGALTYFYFTKDFKKLGHFVEDRDDETKMTEKFGTLKVRNFCTFQSFTEHIGQVSVLNKWRPTPVRRAVYGQNLVPGKWLDLARSFGNPSLKSDTCLDVVIPVAAKDWQVFPMVVASLKQKLKHPVEKIYVVSQNSRMAREKCRELGCQLIAEERVLSITPNKINYRVEGTDRSGWIFQQLVKLSADKIARRDYILVIDADTVLLQPQIFIADGKIVYLVADEWHEPYRRAYQRVFKERPKADFSFIAHQMLLLRPWLQEFRQEIEKKNRGKTWYEVIIDNLDKQESSSFSEYESYGNWTWQKYPEKIRLEYFFNKRLGRDQFDTYKNLDLKEHRSVSFHQYDNS